MDTVEPLAASRVVQGAHLMARGVTDARVDNTPLVTAVDHAGVAATPTQAPMDAVPAPLVDTLDIVPAPVRTVLRGSISLPVDHLAAVDVHLGKHQGVVPPAATGWGVRQAPIAPEAVALAALLGSSSLATTLVDAVDALGGDIQPGVLQTVPTIGRTVVLGSICPKRPPPRATWAVLAVLMGSTSPRGHTAAAAALAGGTATLASTTQAAAQVHHLLMAVPDAPAIHSSLQMVTHLRVETSERAGLDSI